MNRESPEVTAYIENASPFAQPILKRIRKAFLKAHPDIQEVMKWSFPHFEYKGIVGNMAAFKQHVSWGFWKAKLMDDPHGLLAPLGETSMGGAKVTRLADLPSEDVLVDYVRQAVRLNEEGVKVARPAAAPKGPLEVPDDLAAALKKNRAAAKTFEAFAPSQKREYVGWLTDAKQDATRKKRLETAIEWMAEGKARHWKYQK